MIGPLSTRVLRACERAEAQGCTPDLQARLGALTRRLAEPRIRVAVGGQMNAGKSTLVNALLGQQLAATGATETTRLVTWFSYAVQDRVRVRRHDGTETVVPAAAGGGVPDDAGLGGPEVVERLVVETPNEELRTRHTIVDTPGMNSLSRLGAASVAALADADGVVYLMPHPGTDDLDAIKAVRAWNDGLNLGAANMIGVLSRIDTLSEATDPWPRARAIAERYAGTLRTSLIDVIPVAGLLAETAHGADFTEADARHLRALAAADRLEVEDAVADVQSFRAFDDAPVTLAGRDRLLTLLGLHGIRVGLELLDEGHVATGALLAALGERSGLGPVLERIDTVFVAGADRLRANAAIAAVDRLPRTTVDPADGRVLQRLRAELDRLRLEPALRQVELAEALRDLDAGSFRLHEPDLVALTALAVGPDDARRLGLSLDAPRDQLLAAADRAITRWRQLEAQPSRVLARHARTARELCEHMYFQVSERPVFPGVARR